MEKMKTTRSMLPTTGCELCASTGHARQAFHRADMQVMHTVSSGGVRGWCTL